MTGGTCALSSLAIAVLALLVERPMHPYEMASTLRERGQDRLVKLTTGSLYRTVERLVADDLARVEGASREGNRPERTVYGVTRRGRCRLEDAVSLTVREPGQEYPRFPVALGEVHVLSPRRLTQDLDARVSTLREQERELSTGLARAAAAGTPEAYLLAPHFLLHQRRTDIAWLTDLAARLTSQELPWPQ